MHDSVETLPRGLVNTTNLWWKSMLLTEEATHSSWGAFSKDGEHVPRMRGDVPYLLGLSHLGTWIVLAEGSAQTGLLVPHQGLIQCSLGLTCQCSMSSWVLGIEGPQRYLCKDQVPGTHMECRPQRQQRPPPLLGIELTLSSVQASGYFLR